MPGKLLVECSLPMPPSVNNLFVNAAKGRGRYPSSKYKTWKRLAGYAMNGAIAKPPLIDAPVELAFQISSKSRNDLDNCAKALIDLLVAHGVLLNDNKAIVKRIVLEWADVQGAVVRVYAYAPN
jgi:Holliday junction resolvase RusA-like endonuclease